MADMTDERERLTDDELAAIQARAVDGFVTVREEWDGPEAGHETTVQSGSEWHKATATDVLVLVAEVRRLRAENAELRVDLCGRTAGHCTCGQHL
jgi:hypothetical protein